MNDDLTGRLWSEAAEMLRARGFQVEDAEAVQVLDITPERAPRTPERTFAWGAERVVRALFDGERVTVTIAREMKL